jgi:hypothetical protein
MINRIVYGGIFGYIYKVIHGQYIGNTWDNI